MLIVILFLGLFFFFFPEWSHTNVCILLWAGQAAPLVLADQSRKSYHCKSQLLSGRTLDWCLRNAWNISCVTHYIHFFIVDETNCHIFHHIKIEQIYLP